MRFKIEHEMSGPEVAGIFSYHNGAQHGLPSSPSILHSFLFLNSEDNFPVPQPFHKKISELPSAFLLCYAEAQQINEDRAAAEEAFEDTAEEETFKETEETAAEEE